MKLTILVAMTLLAVPVRAADDNMDVKFQSLQDAVAQKKVPDVKKLSLELFPLVQDALCETAPQGEDERVACCRRCGAKLFDLSAQLASGEGR